MAELAPAVFVLVFLAIIAVPVLITVSAIRRNRAARNPATGEGLSRLAAGKGWHHVARDDEFLARFDGYPLGGGQGRPALDLVTGTHRGRQFACFQYAPPRRSMAPGEYPLQVDYIRVFVLSLPASVPDMLIDDTSTAPRWTRKYTVGDDAFDRVFVVGTEDEKFAGRILTEPVRRWLLDRPPAGPLRFGGQHLIRWRADTGGFDACMVEPALDYMSDLLDRVQLTHRWLASPWP